MGAKYVVEGACVNCTKGSAPTTLVASTNSRIGSQLRIVETDTSPKAFAGNFGICATLTAKNNGVSTPCAMSNLPKWLVTNANFISGSALPCVTMDSFLVCTAGGGAIMPTVDGQSMGSFALKMLIESYGFSTEDASLIMEAYVVYMANINSKQSPKDQAHKFFSNFSALCLNYDGDAIRWNLTAGNPKTKDAQKYFERLGMSKDNVIKLTEAINRQHQNPLGGKDFAHEIVQFAIFTNNDGAFNTLLGPIIGDLSALGSYKGDVYSTRMGIDDMNSDLDAQNMYRRFGFDTANPNNWLQVMTDYNRAVLTGDVNRADEFLSNMGNGDPSVGFERLKEDLDRVDIGSQYISQGLKAIIQDAFMSDALVQSGAFLEDPKIYEKISNQGRIESSSQGGATVEETKQAFYDYLESELNKQK